MATTFAAAQAARNRVMEKYIGVEIRFPQAINMDIAGNSQDNGGEFSFAIHDVRNSYAKTGYPATYPFTFAGWADGYLESDLTTTYP